MKATEKEQKCIDFANQIRLNNAPELSYVWLIGTWRTDEQIAYANTIMKNDPPFKFEEVKAHYANNYNVCGDKTFSNLWDTKGLRNYGVNYWNNISVANEDLLLCQQFWFCTLYDKSEAAFDALVQSIKEEISASMRKFLKENPGSFVSPADPHQMVPEKIDLIYGNYLKEWEIQGDINEQIHQNEKPRLVPQKSKEKYFIEYPYLNECNGLPF